jgi:hypothetical protein
MEHLIEKLLSFGQLFLMALGAASAKTAYQSLAGTPFKFGVFLANLAVAVFAAWLAGSMIPETLTGRDALIGVAAYMGSTFIKLLEDRLTSNIGGVIK